MRIVEKIVFVFILIALTLRLLLIAQHGTYIVYSLFALTSLYFYFGVAIFNGIRFREIFKKASYANIPISNIVIAVLSGIAMSIACIGIVFKMQFWAGGAADLYFGTLLCLVLFVISLVKKNDEYAHFYKRIRIRMAILLCFCFVFICIPKQSLFEFMFRDHPALIQSTELSWKNPENQELREQSNKEWMKFNQE